MKALVRSHFLRSRSPFYGTTRSDSPLDIHLWAAVAPVPVSVAAPVAAK
jgi:hypothetical protein